MNNIAYIKHIFSACRKDIFLVDKMTETEMTYQEVESKALEVLGKLHSINIVKGNRLGIALNNGLDCAILYLACMLGGIVVVPINSVLGEEHASFVMQHGNVKKVIIDERLALYDAIKFKSERLITYKKFNQLTSKEVNSYLDDFTGDESLVLVYTSGTTAIPKGVVHTYNSLLGNGRMFLKAMGVESNRRFINFLPMSYLGGYYNLLMIPMLSKGSVLLTEAFGPGLAISFWDIIKKYGVDTIWFVPTIISMLLKLDRGQSGIDYCNLTELLCFVGTAPLDRTVQKSFEEKYGLILYENFALSETLFLTSQKPGKRDLDTVGEILDEVNIYLFDEDKKEVLEGIPGEIYVKTPYLMKEYNGITDEVTCNGLFCTGDMGIIINNKLTITGRKKDMIIRGGINISPKSVESIVYTVPSISRCAVLGVPDEVMGENILCAVSIKEHYNQQEAIEDIHAILLKKAPSIHLPTKYLIVEDFPYTSSGKIQKNIVKENYLNEQYIVLEAKKIKSNAKRAATASSQLMTKIQQASSVRYNNMVYELKKEGHDIITLSLGEAFFDIPMYPMNDLKYPDVYHYSHSRGIIGLREQLSQYFLKSYDVKFDAEKDIIITAGSKVAIYMSLLSILDQQSEVLVPEPAWVSYPEQIKLCHGIPVMIPVGVGINDYEKYITEKTKAIIICNPNNPSGYVYTKEELEQLLAIANKHELYIISDEAYSDFVDESDDYVSIGSLDRKFQRSILVNSMSKNYGISGWRIGYVITNEMLTNEILKLNQHLITCPSTILEMYLEKHFHEMIVQTKPQIQMLLEKRIRIQAYLNEIGLEHLKGTSTFYFFVSIEPSTLSSEGFADRLLLEKKICVVPGIGYGLSCDKYIRVAIGTESDERIFEALDTIKELIKNTSLQIDRR